MNYLIAAFFAIVLLGIYAYTDSVPTFGGMLTGALIYISIGLYRANKSWHFLSLLEKVSKMPDESAAEDLSKIISNQTFLDKLIEFLLSAIITVLGIIGGYFDMSIMFIGWTASCVFMLNAQDVWSTIADILHEEEQEEEEEIE